jgi:hypothetical protein
MLREMLIISLLVLLITSICYSADSIDEFIKDLNEAAILYQKNKYQDVIALLEKHSENELEP